MVKNTTGGNKHKKQKNSIQKIARPLTIVEDPNEGYGQVTNFLGGNMITVRKLGTTTEFRCRLKKSLPKIKKKDIILYAMREYEIKDIGDVLLVYTIEEVSTLKRNKYIIEDIEIDELFEYEKEDDEDEDTNNLNTNINNLDINEDDINNIIPTVTSTSPLL